MSTIETETKKYRMCRAEMERGCGIACENCPWNMPESWMWKLSQLDVDIRPGLTLP